MSHVLRKLAGFGRYLVWGFVCFLLLLCGLIWYATTNSFQQLVRRHLVASIEHATGGRAEMGSFHVVPFRLQVEIRNLTIHGRETPPELPLMHVDSVSAVVKLSAALGGRLGFHSLTLIHPVVHIIFYPDGSSNQPRPAQSGQSDLTHLFSISINRLEVRRGELLLQDQKIPLECMTNDVSAELNYSFLHFRYSGNAAIGRAETNFDGYRPVDWAAQASFSIDHAGIEIQSLTATAGGSKLMARGAVTDFRDPVFKGSYDLSLNLPQAAAIARQPGITEGSLEIEGIGAWSQASFSANGSFDLRKLDWQDKRFSAKSASASGKFSIDPKKIQLSRVEGRFLRGNFTSEAELENWYSSRKPAAKTPPEQRGSIKVKASDFSLADLVAGMGTRLRPIKELRLAGNLSGTSEINWRNSWRDAEINGTFAVAAPNRVLPGQMPVTANGGVTYDLRPGTLELRDFSANTPATQIRASGPLNSAAALRFSIASVNISEWRPVITALVPEGLPIAIRGRAAFSGTLSGTLPDVTLAGNLQLQDFDTAPPRRAEAPVHWDSLNADLQISPWALNVHNATARSGDTNIKLNGQASLADWKPVGSSRFRVHVDAQNVDAAEADTIAGSDLKVQGKLNAQLDASGTIASPEADGDFKWTNGLVEGYSFDDARAKISLRGREAAFKELDITRGRSHISGRGAYDVADKSFHFAVSGTNFNIADVAALERSRIRIGGTLDFSADVAGTRANPDVDAHLYVRGLTFNDELAGDYLLDAVTHGQELRITGQSEFQTGQLAISGDVTMRDRWPAQMRFHFASLDVNAFIQSYLQGPITGPSTVAGDITVQGPLLDPRLLKVTGNLGELSADVEHIKLHNQGPVEFSVAGQTAQITSLHIIGEDTDFSASGSVQLAADRKIDVQANGQIGLKLVESYDPDLSGSGTVMLAGNVTGTLSAPKVNGKLEINKGALADINLPSALSGINGTLTFNQNQVTIDTLTAQTGGGNMSFSGHAELLGQQVNFDLTAKADTVRLRYPPGVSSTANANLRWNGSSRGSLLSGDVTLTKISVTPGFDFGTYLEKAVEQASLPQTDPVLNKIRLDLHVVTTPELQMQTSVLRVRGDADLRVRGNAARPALLGRAEIFEGEAYFNGTKYRLERGGITFGTPAANNPSATVPYVDFEATTRVQDYDITLSINGPADHPRLNYRSEPPLPTNDIIGLLAFGTTSEQSAQLQQNSQSVFSQQASNAMLAAALNATLNNRAQRLFGNSRIKIDPQGLETETSPTQNGPAVTIEQQVKNNLTVTYTTNVSQTSQQVIRAEYNLTRNVSIVAIRDQTGVISFDVKIRRRRR